VMSSAAAVRTRVTRRSAPMITSLNKKIILDITDAKGEISELTP
jgi:hypothetical protein